MNHFCLALHFFRYFLLLYFIFHPPCHVYINNIYTHLIHHAMYILLKMSTVAVSISQSIQYLNFFFRIKNCFFSRRFVCWKSSNIFTAPIPSHSRKVRKKSHKNNEKTHTAHELITCSWKNHFCVVLNSAVAVTRYAFFGNLLQFFEFYTHLVFFVGTKSYHQHKHIPFLMHFNFSFDFNDDIDF